MAELEDAIEGKGVNASRCACVSGGLWVATTDLEALFGECGGKHHIGSNPVIGVFYLP